HADLIQWGLGGLFPKLSRRIADFEGELVRVGIAAPGGNLAPLRLGERLEMRPPGFGLMRFAESLAGIPKLHRLIGALLVIHRFAGVAEGSFGGRRGAAGTLAGTAGTASCAWHGQGPGR